MGIHPFLFFADIVYKHGHRAAVLRHNQQQQTPQLKEFGLDSWLLPLMFQRVAMKICRNLLQHHR